MVDISFSFYSVLVDYNLESRSNIGGKLRPPLVKELTDASLPYRFEKL